MEDFKVKEEMFKDARDIYYVECETDDEIDSEDPSYSIAQKDENGHDANSTVRNEFKKNTREQLMIRAGLRCSNPFCRKMTVAFDPEIGKTISIGEAAHIVAAIKGGPRNDGRPEYNSKYIKSINNGLWLCSNCHSMIDKPGNEEKYSVELLHQWKNEAESIYINQISKPRLDFINSIKEDVIGRVDFKFEEASGLQIALVIYLLDTDFHDKSFSFLRANPFITEMEYGDGFLEEYLNFYNWITSSKCRKLYCILNVKLINPSKINYHDAPTYMRWKSIFEDELLANNFLNIVSVTEDKISTNSENVRKAIFKNNYDAIDELLKKVLI